MSRIGIDEQELRSYARVGALEQAKHIVAEFPDILAELNTIAGGGANGDAPTSLAERLEQFDRKQHGGRRSMSAAERRAVGRRMRAYWRKRRAAKGRS